MGPVAVPLRCALVDGERFRWATGRPFGHLSRTKSLPTLISPCRISIFVIDFEYSTSAPALSLSYLNFDIGGKHDLLPPRLDTLRPA